MLAKVRDRIILALVPALWMACGVGHLDEEFESSLEAQEGWRTGQVLIDGESVQLEYEVVNGERLLEGDILLDDGLILSEDQSEDLSEVVPRLAAVMSDRQWPRGVVPYNIDPGLPNTSRVHSAIAHWEAHTAIRFVRRTTERDYVTFRPSTGCSSSLGRVGGRQYINLATNCSVGTTIHEIGHAVGAYHEQARTDRDSYINIYWSNIQSGKERNFKTYRSLGRDGRNIGSYDLDSIMHYNSYTFSRNGRPTILRKNGAAITRNSVLSAGDKAAITRMYGAPACGSGDGLYCGGNGVPGPSDTLYRCSNGTPSKVQTCADGCQRMPAGTPDKCAAPPPTESGSIIIDNDNARNDKTRGVASISANWKGASSTSGFYGNNYRWSSAAPVSDAAVFSFYASEAGVRTIDARWTAGANRSDSAPFVILNSGGSRIGTVHVNQKVNGGKWNTLGSFRFTRGWNRVLLSRWTDEGTVVVADAVRIR